ncbi:hypothetical protein DEA98_11180 [Brucella pseudogrignonensis]|nr:hypothetical protein [Brucella pseudogrignonensis]
MVAIPLPMISWMRWLDCVGWPTTSRFPTVTHFVSTTDEAWLLMTALAGETAYQALEARPEERTTIVDALADFLRTLHAIPISECPFTSDHSYRLGLARKRIDAGLVEEDDFDEEREGWTAEQVWRKCIDTCLSWPIRLSHMGTSRSITFMVDGVVIGCIDAGRVGIADRYQDLAILWNCLGEFDEALQDRFSPGTAFLSQIQASCYST